MKKRMVSVLLTAAMVMGMLSGCGNSENTGGNTGCSGGTAGTEVASSGDADTYTVVFG